MTDSELRPNLLQKELLHHYTVTSVAELDAPQMEAFRASAGLHPTDPAWLVLVDRWQAAAPGKKLEDVKELQTWPDHTLFSLMNREDLTWTVRQAAAVELHRRKSKYTRTVEFYKFQREEAEALRKQTT